MNGYRTPLNAALNCSGTKQHFCFQGKQRCYKKELARYSGEKDERVFSCVLQLVPTKCITRSRKSKRQEDEEGF